MGVMNLLKGNWYGKVGQTVGSKWKNLSTIRTYTKPSNPNTAAQQLTRNGFKAVSSFVALFSDQIRPLTALDTRRMSVRNVILSLNADMVAAGAITEADLVISKGGLPEVTGFTAAPNASNTAIECEWDEVEAQTVSAKAKVVVVVVDNTNKKAFVGSALNSAEELTIPAALTVPSTLSVYYYLLDYRGSSKVASANGYESVAVTQP